MRMKEKEKQQNLLVKLSSFFLFAGFLIPGFAHKNDIRTEEYDLAAGMYVHKKI